jgi:dolichol-phosphate mannosyltransferase
VSVINSVEVPTEPAAPFVVLMQRLMSVGAFGLVGLSGIALNQVLLAGLVTGGHINYLLAALLASVGSSTSNFLLTELWVFRARRRGGMLSRFMSYLLLTFASTPLRLPILYVLTSLHGVHYLVSNLVAIVAVFGGRYLVSDLLIWRRQFATTLEVNVTE